MAFTEYLWLSLTILGYARVSLATFSYIGLSWAISIYLSLSWAILDYPGLAMQIMALGDPQVDKGPMGGGQIMVHDNINRA